MGVYRKGVKEVLFNNTDMEFIAVQNTNKINALMKAVSDCVASINEDVDNYETVKSSYYNKISVELSTIFKFKINTIYEKNATPKVYIVPTKATSNALVKDIGRSIEIYDTVSTMTEEISNKDKLLVKAREALNSSLDTSGIKIDLNNTTITGIDSKYRNIIMIDIRSLVLKYKLTSDEIVAELLHEVGHVFDYFKSLEFSSDSASMLLDDIRTEYIGKSKNSKEVLLAYYKKIGGDSDSIKDKNVVSVAIDVSKAILNRNTNTNMKEEEYSADVFAVRFGLGSSLISALRKMDSDYEYINIVLINSLIVLSSVISLMYIILLPFSVLATVLYTILIASISGIMSFSRGNTKSNYRYNNASYDNMVDRLSRIKQQMIGSLPYIEDKEIAKSMIEQIDATSLMLSKQKSRVGLIDSILKNISFKRSVIDTQYMVESLLNSDLIIAKKRIDLI